MSVDTTSQLEMIIPLLEAAIPEIVTLNLAKDGLSRISQAAELMEDTSLTSYDENIKSIAGVIKLLINSETPFLATTTFQSYILDVLEELNALYTDIKAGNQGTYQFQQINNATDFLLKLSERLMVRYKIRVEFEPEYEAKSLRAFMVLKELKNTSRFLVVEPDLAENQGANLDGGLDIEILSQEYPKKLHEIASEVLEVKSVEVYEERRNNIVYHLDPPAFENSLDSKYANYLS